ncbi:Isoleucine--tRNA ligase [Candidatus Westeberhardia cardiocondylae]|uniref:Isoleucine--tRNA ligase n=1 Tax=Candidatus Westeberhardia cardiocondylae TaxID=1594731 RepID=A0A0H5C5V3_9ENTR|nr:isoleucine--tRNA ligase [Candidatus Westeberhardia cardiocondylae]CEN32341.1 Isoleucine--tRNA ligase [Candidatus Westeberhardia cardiocondylae]
MKNYKDTLNMPNTKFPMQGNLQKNEPKILQKWNEKNIYKKIRDSKKGKKIFFLHDGPVYANGNIHIGHAINKILKDIIIKFKGLMGYDAPYVPGWDCHGLPIELQVEKKIGKPGKNINRTEFQKICRNYAKKQIIKQKKDFIRLGIFGDWNNPYLTMNYTTEANTIRTFKKIVSKGHLYKGMKPTYWCVDCTSTLAESEVEYYNTKSLSIYFTFKSNNTEKIIKKFNIKNQYYNKTIYLIIWTTNPWTLPGNQAIAINPKHYYQLIEINGKNNFIINANLVKKIMQKMNIQKWKIIGTTQGKNLELEKFEHPLIKFNVPIVLNKNITEKTGTGLVHIAPGHGLIDYLISKKYNLKIINLINKNGLYKSEIFPQLNNLNIKKVNDILLNMLKKKHALLHTENTEHAYPHCWRHKTPVIFRSTPQWFINVFKKQSILDQINWIPKWGKHNMKNMLINSPDWCISRQRVWGVPIPFFVHNQNNTLHPNTINLIENVAKIIEKNGIQAWNNLKEEDILGKEDAKLYHKITDTLDVWFDSGATYFSVTKTRPEFMKQKPDIYLEGHDQYRGWFLSSIIISNLIEKKPPCNKIISHGFSVDKKGNKMSKSIGNIITPKSIVNKFGADILRLWIASTNYINEMSISNEVFKNTIDIYRKIRNTIRFLLSNLNDFDTNLNILKKEKMIELDCWAVSRASNTQKKIISFYEKYEFHNVVKQIMQFCSIDMSSFYLNIIKDRQYTTKKNGINRRSCQTAMYHIIEALVRWISPIIPFTANEIWSFIPGKRKKYIFTETWYENLFILDKKKLIDNNLWKLIQKIQNETNKIIEYAKIKNIIRSSLEANIILYAKKKLAKKLFILKNELHFALLTSSAKIKNFHEDYTEKATICKNIEGLKIFLTKSKKIKCPRCWHYKIDDKKENDRNKNICGRCINNIYGEGEKRKFI